MGGGSWDAREGNARQVLGFLGLGGLGRSGGDYRALAVLGGVAGSIRAASGTGIPRAVAVLSMQTHPKCYPWCGLLAPPLLRAAQRPDGVERGPAVGKQEGYVALGRLTEE